MPNITRRDALELSGQAVLTLLATGPIARLAYADEFESVSWERFLELCHSSYENYNEAFPEIRGMHYEERFMVSMLEFEAGEDIPLHDHPDMTGVIYCTAGSVAVEHFDKLEETADGHQARAGIVRQGDPAHVRAVRVFLREDIVVVLLANILAIQRNERRRFAVRVALMWSASIPGQFVK